MEGFFKKSHEWTEGRLPDIHRNEKGFTNAEIAQCALLFAIVIFIVIGSIAAITEAREVLAKMTVAMFK
jgi:hypothetical protein